MPDHPIAFHDRASHGRAFQPYCSDPRDRKRMNTICHRLLEFAAIDHRSFFILTEVEDNLFSLAGADHLRDSWLDGSLEKRATHFSLQAAPGPKLGSAQSQGISDPVAPRRVMHFATGFHYD